jgi:hypothetical protein
MEDKRVREIARTPDMASELTPKETRELLEQVEKTLDKQPRLLEIPDKGQTVFVGDTHGDFDATKTVVGRYLGGDRKLVFLGDYVDRGEASRANINYLLCLKLAYPARLFLLQGNHEGYGIFKFFPADFWESTEPELRALYEKVLLKLPLAVSTGNIIALHGALPDIGTLSDIDKIQPGGEAWQQIVWGDWQETSGDYLGIDAYTGRPQFGRGYFDRVMKRLNKSILVRSHQPGSPRLMYANRCLTIFTSHAYMPLRTVTLADWAEEINTASDLLIESI